MEYKIVFSDVDGTLLNSSHLILPSTLTAIEELKRRNIEFVIVSARSPSGIYPILERSEFVCPIICYSGALILDKNRTPLYSTGFCKSKGKKIIDYIELNQKEEIILNKSDNKYNLVLKNVIKSEEILKIN